MVLLGILGSNLEPLNKPFSLVISNYLISWICLHLPARTSVAMGEFFFKLVTMFLVFRMGIFSICGV